MIVDSIRFKGVATRCNSRDSGSTKSTEFRTLDGGGDGQEAGGDHGGPSMSAGHRFAERRNQNLEDAGFDAFIEGLCVAFYASRQGRRSVRPARSICLLFSGYFERLSSERGTPWWVADSLNLQAFPTRMLRARRRAARCCRVRGCWSSWTRIWRGSLGCWSGCPTRFRCVGRWSASIRRRWNRMPRCGASSGGIPATRTRLSCGVWRRGRGGDTDAGGCGSGSTGRGKGRFANNECRSPQDRDAKIAKTTGGPTHPAHMAEYDRGLGHAGHRLGDGARCVGRRHGDPAGDTDRRDYAQARILVLTPLR